MYRIVLALLAVVGVAVVVGGLVGITSSTEGLDAARDQEEAIARWHGLGGSTAPAGMVAPTLPPQNNAAPLYQRALAALKRLSAADRRALRALLDDDDATTPGGLAHRVAPATALARAASERPACVWDPGRGLFDANIPDRAELLSLATALALEARSSGEAGDTGTAAADLIALRTFAGHLAAHPRVVFALDAVAIERLALRALEEVFRGRPLPEGAAEALAAEPRDYRSWVRRALLTEGAVAPRRFEQAGAERDELDIRLDRTFYLQAMCRRVEALDRGVRPSTEEPPPWAVRARLLLPPTVDPAALADVRTRAAMARAALRLRAADGEYPETWAPPADEPAAAKLRYRRLGDGFVLWSEDDPGLRWKWT